MQVVPHDSPQNVLVIGGGIAGAATAWGLSQRGIQCTVLERESQLGAHSTSKNASILRTCTGHRASRQLALETAAFLHDPPAGFTAVPLVDAVGLVLIPCTLDPEEYDAWHAQKAPGSVERLSPEQLEELMPHWNGAKQGAFLVHDEGHIDTSMLFDCFVRQAKLAGAQFRLQAQVDSILTEGTRATGVRLKDGSELHADCVVIAAGAWAEPLGHSLGSSLQLEPRRRHLLVTGADAEVDARAPILWSEVDAYYVRPESGGLMLCACDQDVVDPDACNPLPAVLELIAQRTAECLPQYANAPAAHFWAGMRTFADDPEFAIGYDVQVPGLFWVAGLGGHGMSTSVGVGRLAARLICGESQGDKIAEAVDPARFLRTPQP